TISFENGGKLRFFEIPGAESYFIFKDGGFWHRLFPSLPSASSDPRSANEKGEVEASNAEGLFEISIGDLTPSAIVGFQVVAVDGAGSSIAYSHMIRARSPGLKP